MRGEPGVYVRPDDPSGHAVHVAAEGRPFDGLAKIAAIGIKAGRKGAWHGVALNVAMDLAPFGRIDPCGHVGLATTDLSTIGVRVAWSDVAATLGPRLARTLSR